MTAEQLRRRSLENMRAKVSVLTVSVLTAANCVTRFPGNVKDNEVANV